MSWSKARDLQTSLRGWDKEEEDEATLVFASANVEAKMQVPKETMAGAIIALWNGQNRIYEAVGLLENYGKQYLALSPDCKGPKNAAGISLQQKQQAQDEESIILNKMCLGSDHFSSHAMGLSEN